MRKKQLILILFIIIILLALSSLFLYLNESQSDKNETVSLGNESYGTVERLGPFGNLDSDVKIAYVVGLHPLESQVHKTFLNEFFNMKDLNYCYYIYMINVTEDVDDYNQGRMNGQLLAQKYVLPDALDEKYSLVVDVHSMEVWSSWDSNQYIFSPINGSAGEKIAQTILKNCSFSEYYNPPDATSPPYLLTPLNEHGIPAICWEEFEGNTQEEMNSHIKTLILTIDNLVF